MLKITSSARRNVKAKRFDPQNLKKTATLQSRKVLAQLGICASFHLFRFSNNRWLAAAHKEEYEGESSAAKELLQMLKKLFLPVPSFTYEKGKPSHVWNADVDKKRLFDLIISVCQEVLTNNIFNIIFKLLSIYCEKWLDLILIIRSRSFLKPSLCFLSSTHLLLTYLETFTGTIRIFRCSTSDSGISGWNCVLHEFSS